MANNTVAYGFIELKDLFARRISTVEVQTLQTAITSSLEMSNKQVDALIAIMVEKGIDYKIRYQLPGGGTLQPLDEFGEPLPVQPTAVYDVAFPLQMGGTAWGTNRLSRAKATVGDVNAWVWDAMLKDIDWVRRHILAAIFTNTTWTYTDEQWGDLVVQPLANNDTVKYVLVNGTVATDNHYFAQAASIADATDPYSAIYTALAHHPSNSGPFVSYIATDLVASTMALTAFAEVRDPDVLYSTTNPVIAGEPVNPNDNQYGSGNDILGFGDRILGKVDNMWVVEWSSLPSSYIVSHARGASDVVEMREEPEAELQGFFPEFDPGNGNLQKTKMIRRAGFGIKNRVGACVTRIGNASYAIPTGYSAPLKV